MPKLLEVNHVSKVFRIGSILRGRKLVAVDDVTLSIDEDKPTILTVVGESGCGKTTLAKMILHVYPMTEGQILINGNDIADQKNYDKHAFVREVQPIFQNPYETFSARKRVDTYLFNTALKLGVAKNQDEAVEVVDRTLKSVGLSLAVVKGKYPGQFSGGELQRCSIARALIPSPKLIVADEPVAAIDASMKMNIVNLFKDLKDEYQVSFLYITHDLSTAYYVSDYVATLYRGNLVEFGPAQTILDHPAHPYTDLLLSSIPKVGDKWGDDSIVTESEREEYQLTACKFAPRCPRATDECFDKMPEHETTEDGRRVLCYHPIRETVKEVSIN